MSKGSHPLYFRIICLTKNCVQSYGDTDLWMQLYFNSCLHIHTENNYDKKLACLHDLFKIYSSSLTYKSWNFQKNIRDLNRDWWFRDIYTCSCTSAKVAAYNKEEESMHIFLSWRSAPEVLFMYWSDVNKLVEGWEAQILNKYWALVLSYKLIVMSLHAESSRGNGRASRK